MNPQPHNFTRGARGSASSLLYTPSPAPAHVERPPRPPSPPQGPAPVPDKTSQTGVQRVPLPISPFPDSLRSCRLESLTVTFSCQKGFISGARALDWVGQRNRWAWGDGSRGFEPARALRPHVPPGRPTRELRGAEQRWAERGIFTGAMAAPGLSHLPSGPGPRVSRAPEEARASARQQQVRPPPGLPGAPYPRQVRQRPECELRGSSWLRLAAPAGPAPRAAPLQALGVDDVPEVGTDGRRQKHRS